MTRRPPAEIPEDHRRAPHLFQGITDGGQEFDLQVGTVRRRAGSSQLVQAHVRAMSRGRPITNDDLYQDETEIVLFIRNRQRVDIRLNPGNTYSVGHRTARSLRAIVTEVLDRFEPKPPSGMAP